MDSVETFHLAAKDLLCPICYQKYDLVVYQPMSLSCGHNICSYCLKKVYNCPLCRCRIYNRNSHSRNVLIGCILEQKQKMKICRVHQRPLEFFCKDHKQLMCVDCSIDGNHFSHNFIRSRELDGKAEKIKGLMKKVDVKDQQSAIKFKSFLDQEKNDIKRKLDDMLDEFLEPVMLMKKKLHKEVDTFILSQGSSYEKETVREMMLKWKMDNQTVINEWESKGEAEAAAQIVENGTEEIEEKLGKYEKQMEKIEAETHGNSDFLMKNLVSRISLAKTPWKKLNRKLGQIMESFKSETNPQLERGYLMEFLKDHGIMANWVEKEGEHVLEVKKDSNEVIGRQAESKYFDCTLEKLRIKVEKIHETRLETVCKALEKVLKLVELNMTLKGVSDEGVSRLGESLQKVKGLQKLTLLITSEVMSDNGLLKLLSVLPGLTKLGMFDLTLEDCDELGNSELEAMEEIFEKLNAMRDFSLRLGDCDSIGNEGLSWFIKGFGKLTQLTKLNLSVCDCKSLTYKIFEPLSKALVAMKDLEELGFLFEGCYERANPHMMMISLANSIASLSKLKKLRLSFTENVYLPALIIKKFIDKITGQLPELREFNLDLSRCREIVNGTLEAIGNSLVMAPKLTKLALMLRMCNISEKGVLVLCSSLLKLNALRSLTLDCRHCRQMEEGAQAKVTEQLAKMTKLTEKEVLFGPEHCLEAPILDSQLNIFSPHMHSPRNDHHFWTPPSRQMPIWDARIIDLDLDDSSYGLEDLFNDDYLHEVYDDHAMMSINGSDLSFE